MSISSVISPMDAGLAANAAAQQEMVQRKLQVDKLKSNIAPAADKQAKLREACEGFESVFVQKMWEQMRKNVKQEGYLHSRDEETYQGMFDQEFSKKMTEAGGIGLADMLYQQLNQRLEDRSRDTSAGPGGPMILPSGATPSSSRFGRAGEGASAQGNADGSVQADAAQPARKTDELYGELKEAGLAEDDGQAQTAINPVLDVNVERPAEELAENAAETDEGLALAARNVLSEPDRATLQRSLAELRDEVEGAAAEQAASGAKAAGNSDEIDLEAYRGRLAQVHAPNMSPPSHAMGSGRGSGRRGGQAAQLGAVGSFQPQPAQFKASGPHLDKAGDVDGASLPGGPDYMEKAEAPVTDAAVPSARQTTQTVNPAENAALNALAGNLSSVLNGGNRGMGNGLDIKM